MILTLLTRRAVSEVHLNDGDPQVPAFWRPVLKQPERFADRIRNVPLTIDDRRQQPESCERYRESDAFDLCFAAFYMNRCNGSGVLIGTGPIGGSERAGSWRLDVRFNREALARRIQRLAALRETIHHHNGKAITFLKTTLPKGRKRQRLLAYPPCVNNSHRLYMNHNKCNDREKPAGYLLSQESLPWIILHDDCDPIGELYWNCEKRSLPPCYPLRVKRLERDRHHLAAHGPAAGLSQSAHHNSDSEGQLGGRYRGKL